MEHSVHILKVEDMKVANVCPTTVNGQITDIVKAGADITDATKGLLDVGYKLEHVIPLNNGDGGVDRFKYIFIREIDDGKCNCSCCGNSFCH